MSDQTMEERWQGAEKVDAYRPSEPIAWAYELAHYRNEDGTYTGWIKYVTYHKPSVPEGSIRNLRPLYD